jgi:hypothetical protein
MTTPCQAGVGACSGLGECVVAGKALLGASCALDADCGEAHCVARADGTSICCDSACDDVCEQCSVGGRCVEARSKTFEGALPCIAVDRFLRSRALHSSPSRFGSSDLTPEETTDNEWARSGSFVRRTTSEAGCRLASHSLGVPSVSGPIHVTE